MESASPSQPGVFRYRHKVNTDACSRVLEEQITDIRTHASEHRFEIVPDAFCDGLGMEELNETKTC